MTTAIIFLIAQQCAGQANCIRYLEKCTMNIVSHWPSSPYQDVEDRARVAISVCEKEYTKAED